MGQITIPSDDDANVGESETFSNDAPQRQQQIEDDAVYSDMENAIQTTDNTQHNDDLRTELEDQSSSKECDTVEETMGSNNILPADEESQAVASSYNDMDSLIKDKANILLPAAIKPPVPPGRISAQVEEMIDALEGDDLAVANKIAKERAGAKNRDTSSSDIMTPAAIKPPLPPGRISAQAEEMIDALEGGELAIAQKIANERADSSRETAPRFEDKVQRKIRDGAYAGAAAREEDSCTTPTHAQNESVVRPGIRPTPRSMLPRQDTDDKSASTNTPVLERKQTPILEASLVPEIPLYEATLIDASVSLSPLNVGYSGIIPPNAQGGTSNDNNESRAEKTSGHVNTANVVEVPWYRKRQGILLIVFTLIFGGAMATTGALLASGNTNDDNGSNDDGNYLNAESDDVGSEGVMSIGPTQSPVDFPTPDKPQQNDQDNDSTASDLDNSKQTDGPTTSTPSTSKPSTSKPTTLESTTSKPTASPVTQAPTVTLYYPDWTNDRCIGDVSGRPGPNQGQTMFVSVEACCKAEFWQLQHEDHNECIMNSLGLTHGPTLSPSSKPTSSPSKSPSKKPSQKPSMEPSSRPTSKPSDEPTSKPSENPTMMPTRQPTSRPTTRLGGTSRPTLKLGGTSRPTLKLGGTSRPTWKLGGTSRPDSQGSFAECPRESMDLCCLGEIPSSFASHQEYCGSLGCNGKRCGELDSQGSFAECPRESMDLCCLGEIPSSFASHKEYCGSLGCNGKRCDEWPPPI